MIKGVIHGRFRKIAVPIQLLDDSFSSINQATILISFDALLGIRGRGLCDISDFSTNASEGDVINYTASIQARGDFVPTT